MAMRALQAGDTQLAEQHWRELAAIWSHAWAANYDVLAYMQEVGLDRFGLTPRNAGSSHPSSTTPARTVSRLPTSTTS